jgi:hypothetical protein
MAEIKRSNLNADPQVWATRRDSDGAVTAQRWAFAIVAAFVAVALVHAIW